MDEYWKIFTLKIANTCMCIKSASTETFENVWKIDVKCPRTPYCCRNITSSKWSVALFTFQISRWAYYFAHLCNNRKFIEYHLMVSMCCYVFYYKHVSRSFRNVVHVIFLIIKIVSRFIRCEAALSKRKKNKDMLVESYFACGKFSIFWNDFF